MITYAENPANAELLRIMKDFYNLTGIKICIYDTEGNEVCYYPERLSEFCEHIRRDERTDAMCLDCDRRALDECKRTMRPKIYTCHAGLTEAVTPITVQGIIRGFIVIGQIRENEYSPFIAANAGNADGKELLKYYNGLQIIPRDKIESALHILEACASFEHLKRFVQDISETIMIKLQKYVDENLNKNLTVDALRRYLTVSRRELYSLIKNEFGLTPAGFVKIKRLEYSKKLLAETSLKISAVAEKCGIGDYNYFSKLFRKEYNVTPREFRLSSKSSG